MLKGVKLVFSGLRSLECQKPEQHIVWKTAEAFGAECFDDFRLGVTHLATYRPDTVKVCQLMWAQRRLSKVWFLRQTAKAGPILFSTCSDACMTSLWRMLACISCTRSIEPVYNTHELTD